nr:MFS-type transporter SLC18B1-like [Nomia melanderi]
MMAQFTKRQWLTLIVISLADFANAICVSLQAPFYPQEAEKKGASPSEYGLVFGIFELVVFIISPVYGQYLHRIGPKLLFNGGILTTGTCAIFFGLLDKVNGHYPFIVLSFVIRIVEAMGNAAFLTASFAIIAKEFPDNVATTFASLETFFGLGLIVGPTVGGALFQVGGYTTPFAVLGFALFITAVMTIFILPVHPNSSETTHATGGVTKVLRIPGVLVATSSIIATSMSIGFLQATLEPHLRQFDLSPVILGLMFVLNGGTYAITAPAWGWLCDKHSHPKVIILMLLNGVAAAVFLSSCTRRRKPYTEIGASEDLRIPLTDSGRSRSGSLRHAGRGQGVPIDRPSGMNSLIACNSYSNRAGAWSRASYSGRYSHSYGSVEAKRYLEITT